MMVDELLERLDSRGITIRRVGNQLMLGGRTELITQEMKDTIAKRRDLLLWYFAPVPERCYKCGSAVFDKTDVAVACERQPCNYRRKK